MEDSRDNDWRTLITSFSSSLSSLRSFFLTLDSKLQEEIDASWEGYGPHAGVIRLLTSSSMTGRAQELGHLSIFQRLYKGLFDISIADGNVEINFVDLAAAESVKSILDGLNSLEQHRDYLRRSALTQLLSVVEAYIPRAILLGSRSIALDSLSLSYSELMQCASVEEARTVLLERRISNELYGGIQQWLEFLKKTFAINASYIDAHRDELLEVSLRRNLFVHGDGIVNATYLAHLPESLQVDAPKRGAKLPISRKYLLNAMDSYEVSFTLLFAEAWDKASGAPDAIAQTILGIAYDALSNGKWDKARALTRFVKSDKRVERALNLYAQFNFWQSYLWAGNFNEVEKDVRNFSTSGLTSDFAVAKAILLDEPSEAVLELVGAAIDSKALQPDALFTWPLFRKLRISAQFDAFVKARGLAEREKRRLGDLLQASVNERLDTDPAEMAALLADIKNLAERDPSTPGSDSAVVQDTASEQDQPDSSASDSPVQKRKARERPKRLKKI